MLPFSKNKTNCPKKREKEIRRKISEETQQVFVSRSEQPAVTISNIAHSVVQCNPAQSTSVLTSPHAQPSTPVQVSPVTQVNSSSFSTATESKTILVKHHWIFILILTFLSPVQWRLLKLTRRYPTLSALFSRRNGGYCRATGTVP